MTKEELLDAYFEGTLTDASKIMLDDLLNSDRTFREDFHFQKELRASLRKKNRKELKSYLSSIGPVSPKKITPIFRLAPWWAAASIALIIGLSSWYFFFYSEPLTNEQLYVAYYEPYENVVHPIERGKQLDDLTTRAFLAYEEGNYSLAIDLFQQVKDKQSNDYIDFYNAIVLMQLDCHTEAIPLFEAYITSNKELSDRAHWYLALCYVKVDAIEKAKEELEILIALKSYKLNSAIDLKKTLE